MTPSARVAAVSELLALLDESESRAEFVVSTYFRNRRFAGSKDRRWITEKFYMILRRRGELDGYLSFLQLPVTARLRAIMSLLAFDGQLLEDVKKAYFSGPHALPPLTEAEDQLMKAWVSPLDTDLSEDSLANLPIWIVSKIKEAYGPRAEAILAAFKERAPATFRVNRQKSDVQSVLAQLEKEGIEAAATAYSPNGFTLKAPKNLMQHDLYREGVIEVQDEAAQIAALLATVQPGMTVMDYCAGGGGKALAMADCMQNQGRLIALDVDRKRMRDINPRCKRAGVECIETKVLPTMGTLTGELLDLMLEMDVVFVDAPCSGSGTWRRQPDQKWTFNEDRLAELIDLQKGVLAQASQFVKPGGCLVYATCSLLPEENQTQVEGFLTQHPEFTQIPVAENWSSANLGGEPPETPYLQITPDQFGADGFFIALMKKSR